MNSDELLPIIVRNPRDQRNPEKTMPKDPNLLKKRVYSFTADLVVIALINKGLMYTYISFLKTYFYQLPLKTQFLLESKVYSIHSVSLLLVFWGYFIISYYWGEGKTPGKLLFGLKVYSPSFKNTAEYHLTLKESFSRTMGYFLCYLTFGLLFGIAFFTKNKKGIPDWLSHTSIVSDEQMTYLDHAYFSPDFKNDFLPLKSSPKEKVYQLASDDSVIELPPPKRASDSSDEAA